MASKSFVRKQSPPSSSPSNANHGADQTSSVNHQGSATSSWASVALNKNSSAVAEATLSNATPASSTTASASSSPRLKQRKDEKNAQRQSKSQNSKGHSASQSSASSLSSSPTPATPTANSSSAALHTNTASEPVPSSISSSPSTPSSPWWHAFPTGLPLGCQVRAMLKNGQECIGVVLSFEDTLKILVLELSSSSSSSSSASTPSSSSSSSLSSIGNDYCMLNFEGIRSVQIVKSDCVTIHLPTMKEEELKLKEQKAIESRREAASRIGVNVSADAQRLFNAISKAYPCVWSNDSIVVADVVSIGPPYTNEQVKPLSDGIQQDNLLRFQKILERERQRLKMK